VKARKNESKKAQSFMVVRRNFSRGGQRRHFAYHFQIAEIRVPSKVILH